jgi:DNA polymerase I
LVGRLARGGAQHGHHADGVRLDVLHRHHRIARSMRNWPVQANGADILRIACILATRHGLELVAPVHDAVLLQAPIGRIDIDVARLQDIMRRAGRVVLGGGIELRTDANIVRYPDRYVDKRGIQMWDRMLELLAAQGITEEERKAK